MHRSITHHHSTTSQLHCSTYIRVKVGKQCPSPRSPSHCISTVERFYTLWNGVQQDAVLPWNGVEKPLNCSYSMHSYSMHSYSMHSYSMHSYSMHSYSMHSYSMWDITGAMCSHNEFNYIISVPEMGCWFVLVTGLHHIWSPKWTPSWLISQHDSPLVCPMTIWSSASSWRSLSSSWDTSSSVWFSRSPLEPHQHSSRTKTPKGSGEAGPALCFWPTRLCSIQPCSSPTSTTTTTTVHHTGNLAFLQTSVSSRGGQGQRGR